MNKAVEFLEECKVFHVATVDGDRPRVRPFGAVMEYNGKIYICTNNKKECFKQMISNPKVEIEATNSAGKWIRITGEVAADPSREAKAAMLEKRPGLRNMYSEDDDIYEVLYFTKGTATYYPHGGQPETFDLYE